MGAANGGIKIGSIGGDFSLRAGGDIVAGNKTVINNIIQRLAKELTTTPYKFLASYDIADRDIFYGRAAVVGELAGAVARHKAIIINGASGAGKSSLVNAGVIPRLADNGYSYVAFREYSDPLEQFTHLVKLRAVSPLPRTESGSDHTAALSRQATTAAVSSSESGPTEVAKAPDLNDPGLLLQLIRALHTTPMVVVFDQFERFFVNVPPNKRSAFITAFKHCMHHSTAQEINFVFALRDEFYGQLLLEFEAQIPEFSNEAYRLNLLPLTQSEAREAIVKPLANTNLRIQYDEEYFVDHVLLAGLAAQTGGSTNVNPPHLQIVCNQLFEAARQLLQQRSSVLIDEKLYNDLGGAQKILNTYLDKVVEEVANDPRRIPMVHSVLQRMIDTTGTRRFVTKELLTRELPDLNETEIITLLQRLLERRVVEERTPAYSLSHDYLVKRVKDWFDPIEMNRKRAQETLERGLAERKNSDALLNRPQVEAVRKWVTSLGSEEQALLQDSEADYVKRESEDTEREKQLIASKIARRRAIQITFSVSLFAVSLLAGIWQMQPYLKERVHRYFTMRPFIAKHARPLTPAAERALKTGSSFRECDAEPYCPEMVVVPPGEFMMGSRDTEKGHDVNESPRHKVIITYPFAVSKDKVTFAEWDACVAVGACKNHTDAGSGRGRHPAFNITWYDAHDYARWLSEVTGKKDYRLLSEAEWEYAARARSTTAYYWGDQIGINNANCKGCGGKWDYVQGLKRIQGVVSVDEFGTNPFGLRGVYGNVNDWCEDSSNGDYDPKLVPTDGSPCKSCNNPKDYRMLRGGAYSDAPADLRSAARHYNYPDVSSDTNGFRIARTLLPERPYSPR